VSGHGAARCGARAYMRLQAPTHPTPPHHHPRRPPLACCPHSHPAPTLALPPSLPPGSFRRSMNSTDNAKSARVTDALLNWESEP
jgi:hypothetical protein